MHFFVQIRRMEQRWNLNEVQRLSKRKKTFVPARISEIRIGDLIMIRNMNICPADVLVVATSDLRHGENIFHTNERRIDGQNIFYTKRTVRNLLNFQKRRIGSREALEKIQTVLSGYIEYEAPSPEIRFSGIFKLNNDPKVSSFCQKNVIFAGTKLCSPWYKKIWVNFKGL